MTMDNDARTEWEERQKDGGDAIRIASSITKSTTIIFAVAASGFAGAATAVFLATSPIMFMITPAVVMVGATALSRAGKNRLRSDFNQMAGEVSPGARMMLRPVDNIIPRHSTLSIDDINPQENPVRIWGGVAIGFFLSLPLALMWVSGLMLAQELKSVGDLNKRAQEVEDQYRLQGYKPAP